MVLELIRLTEKDETVDEVSTSKTPRTLRRFLVDCQALSDQGLLFSVTVSTDNESHTSILFRCAGPIEKYSHFRLVQTGRGRKEA